MLISTQILIVLIHYIILVHKHINCIIVWYYFVFNIYFCHTRGIWECYIQILQNERMDARLGWHLLLFSLLLFRMYIYSLIFLGVVNINKCISKIWKLLKTFFDFQNIFCHLCISHVNIYLLYNGNRIVLWWPFESNYQVCWDFRFSSLNWKRAIQLKNRSRVPFSILWRQVHK